MTKRFLAAALLSTALVGGAAYAQQTNQPSQAPAATTTPAPAATAPRATTGDKMMLKGQWRASKLIGLDVYNEANEKLGDINELIVDKDGKINAVVIGVGGFLGMGEHDIAVTMDKLKFVEDKVRTSSTATTPARQTTTTTAPAPTTPAPTGAAADRRDTTTGAATTTTTTTTTARATTDNDWTPDHAVMSGTKDQLKAMPQFKYSDYN
jgi:sporulation protein YlmC with PRC-barrel domain